MASRSRSSPRRRTAVAPWTLALPAAAFALSLAASLPVSPAAPPDRAPDSTSAPATGSVPASTGAPAPAQSSGARLPGEAALLGKLMAPCCWTQTLDVHAGATPDALRAEIHARLLAGETPRSIEDDFVARYGPRILAEPPTSPLPWLSLGLAALALSSAAGVSLLIRRWVRHAQDASKEARLPGSNPSAGRDEWDDRLDDELRALDT